jgi:starch-binding outer membrane protein, SusD/RagB family
MMSIRDRARWVAIAGLFTAGSIILAGCDVKQELLAPQNPGLIDPSAVTNPTAAYALKVGAVGKTAVVVDGVSSGGNCGGNSECLWEEVGSLTDEYHNADFQNTRQDIDQRSVGDDNPSVPYTNVTQQRGFIRDAIAAVQQYIPDSTADLGEMYNSLAFLELSLAENFCNGIPLGHTISGEVTYGVPLTDAQVLDSANTHLDSALAINSKSSAQAQFIHQQSLILKARVLVDQGKFDAAAALVPTSTIPSNFAYYFATSQAKNTSLGLWSIVNSTARLSVSDSFEIVNGSPSTTKNALPFASAGDPRVNIKAGSAVSPKVVAEDGSTPQFVQLIWARFDPIAQVSGVDARLIEAEAKLNSGDYAGMTTILNALRTAPPKISNYQPAAMAPLTAPTAKDAAVTLFFREKAFWTFGRGQRLNDMRRLMRQYGRTEDQVFPTGDYFKGGTYGHTIVLPVTNTERTNPNFTGCIDRNP